MSFNPLLTAVNAVGMMSVFSALKSYGYVGGGGKSNSAFVTLDVLPDRNIGAGFTPLDHEDNNRRAWVTALVGVEGTELLSLVMTVEQDLEFDNDIPKSDDPTIPDLCKCTIYSFGSIDEDENAMEAVAAALLYIVDGMQGAGVQIDPHLVRWPVAEPDFS